MNPSLRAWLQASLFLFASASFSAGLFVGLRHAPDWNAALFAAGFAVLGVNVFWIAGSRPSRRSGPFRKSDPPQSE